MNEPVPFRDVLQSEGEFSYREWLYLPSDVEWTVDSPCLHLQSDEVPPEDEDKPMAGVPELAIRLNMMQALPMSDLGSIVRNARQQKSDVSAEELFAAFLHYYDHDAFMSWE